MADKDKDKEFLARTSLIFKQFNHDVSKRLKNSTWDFETLYLGKKFAIVCLPKTSTQDFLQSGGETLDKYLEKADETDMRLVIVCRKGSPDDFEFSKTMGFCLVGLDTLNDLYSDIMSSLG
jgi:hypothetical protein